MNICDSIMRGYMATYMANTFAPYFNAMRVVRLCHSNIYPMVASTSRIHCDKSALGKRYFEFSIHFISPKKPKFVNIAIKIINECVA
jgi:hypothetical protein